MMWLPRACLGDHTSARSPLLHGSDNRVQSEALRSINADDGGTLFCVPSQGAFHQKNKDALETLTTTFGGLAPPAAY
jgi:hypothetical protein